MPISKAWQLAEAAKAAGKPEAVFIGGSFREYAAVSRAVMAILREYSPMVEQTSVDEAYFDLSRARSFERAAVIARNIQKEIQRTEKITASVGISPNKLISKIAADFKKPNGLTIVFPEDAAVFLAPLSANVLPGVGPKTEAVLALQKLKTVADIQHASREGLIDRFGKYGAALHEYAHGRDERPLEEPREAKSIGAQETFRYDTNDPSKLTALLQTLSAGVYKEFVRDGFGAFRIVVLTIRFADFKTLTRRATLAPLGSTAEEIYGVGLRLLLPFLDARENPQKKLIRLLGIRIEGLSTAGAPHLF